ncbi:MAG: inositol monophosphatase family protein [Phycisphaerae bacterium]|nr:inositol monophosphatase family protein [Phycisphaerae bacterium]
MSGAATTNARRSAALDAVRAAAIATEFARARQFNAVTKTDASPVTVADFASQAVVAHLLLRRLGEARMLGEETDTLLRSPQYESLLEAVVTAARAAVPSMEATDVLAALALPRADPRDGPCWTLDPVDGTKGYLRGGHYAIALAWLEGGTAIEGTMGCPSLDITQPDPSVVATPGVIATAASGDIARVDSLVGGDIRPLATGNWQRGDPIRLALSFEAAHGNADAAAALAERVGRIAGCVHIDSSAKYVLVAAGRADAYLRIPRDVHRAECVWDHAAGVCIARQAGCVACDLDGKELDFARGATLDANRGIIVAPPRLAELLVAAGPGV